MSRTPSLASVARRKVRKTDECPTMIAEYLGNGLLRVYSKWTGMEALYQDLTQIDGHELGLDRDMVRYLQERA